MNPIILLALGGVALMAMTKKKPPTTTNGNGEPSGNDEVAPENGLPDVVEDDHLVEEATVVSAGGVEYEGRIWRVYEAEYDYLGELYVPMEEPGTMAWIGGPMADDLPTVRAGLQEMADSFDMEGTQFEQVDPCAHALPGPFQAVGYDPAQQVWVPFPSGGTFMDTDQPQTGRYWCVVSYVEGGLSYLEGRVTDEQGNLLYVTGPETDPHIAASKAGYVALQGTGDLPWPVTGGHHWEP